MLQIGLTGLSTKNLDYLGEQTIALSEKNSNAEVIANVLFQQVKTTHNLYSQVVIKQTYSGMGTDLKALDFLRDKMHSGIRNIVDGYAAFEGNEKYETALVLQKMITEAGPVYNLSYAEESVVLNNLIGKFHQPENRRAISVLGIVAEVERLTAVQAEFDTLYIEQVNANSDLRQQASASSMRKDLETALRNYFGLVSAMSSVEPWRDIYSDLNELLKKF